MLQRIRLPARFVLVGALALSAGAWQAGPPVRDGVAGGGAGTPSSEMTLELAREELGSGRHWHAAELLMALRDEVGLPADGLLLLARARAGFRDWQGVREILSGAPWLDSLAPVDGHLLLGRVHESAGEWGDAAGHYGVAAAARGGFDFPLEARLARASLRSGDLQGALAILDRMPRSQEGPLTSFLAWELGEWARTQGDSAAVTALLERIRTPELRRRAQDFHASAVLLAGDSIRAEALYRDLLDAGLDARLPAWKERVATLTLARGDTAAAWALFRETLTESGRSPSGMESARRLVRLGGLDRELALRAARALDRMGEGALALSAYDTYVSLSRAQGDEPDPAARVERARLAATVPSRVGEAVEEFRALDEHPDPAVGARVLQVWAELRRRQGQTENVRTLRRWLVERYPDTDQAAEVVYLQGDMAQDTKDWDVAIRHYREVATMAPTRSLAGQARMRVGQLQVMRGDLDAALDAYKGYLADFPTGRRWAEASFWAGKILAQRGDTTGAEPLLERILSEDPFSYYAVEAADLLGRPFPWHDGEDRVFQDAPWVGGLLSELDGLADAGLHSAAALHVADAVRRADAEGPGAQYPLAEGLIARGWTIEGINRGWSLVRSGEGWNLRLLRILYPFPNREMVEREAAEWGLDPLLMAGLIRQESAWDRDIVSAAGAVGLMQVMPPTGRQLARAVGPLGFTPESLESAEVNLHLGGRFLRDMLDRFGPDLPLVLSAYNAGPTRATRWRAFPESSDRLRFTERIPFQETRGYVKNVTRNLAIYRALYGAGRPASVTQ